MFVSTRRLAAAAFALAACAAQGAQTVYVPQSYGVVGGYLIDWNGATAHVISGGGNAGGSVARSGRQRVVTLAVPISVQFSGFDSCGGESLMQADTQQVAVTTVTGTDGRGTSAVVEVGVTRTLTGCDAGTEVPFGSLTDPGLAAQHLPMSARPSVSDLVPGIALAGPSEEPASAGDPFVSADVLTLQAGGMASFARSGHVVPASFDADQWLVLILPGFERAYARILVDRSGAERWLMAERAGGVPQTVQSALMVKPAAGAGFGGVRRASRIWESGLFAGSNNPFFIELYATGAGARVSKDLAAGTETRTPVTWAFSGPDIVQTRALGSDSGVRTWKPLANGGGRAHFVMEDEIYVPADGTPPFTLIKPRINFYIDEGAATPPATRAR
jgi:hypothetical protein